MNLVNELENDMAMAFFVEKLHAEMIDSNDVVALITKVREILEPELDDEETVENMLIAGIGSDLLSH